MIFFLIIFRIEILMNELNEWTVLSGPNFYYSHNVYIFFFPMIHHCFPSLHHHSFRLIFFLHIWIVLYVHFFIHSCSNIHLIIVHCFLFFFFFIQTQVYTLLHTPKQTHRDKVTYMHTYTLVVHTLELFIFLIIFFSLHVGIHFSLFVYYSFFVAQSASHSIELTIYTQYIIVNCNY